MEENNCHVTAVGLLTPADIGGEQCEGCPHNIHGENSVLLSGVTGDVKKLLFEDCEIVPVGTKAKIEELETENRQLRKALDVIAIIIDNECRKRVPAPSCVESERSHS